MSGHHNFNELRAELQAKPGYTAMAEQARRELASELAAYEAQDGSAELVFTAIYQIDDNGEWFVHVPDLPGCHSQGSSLESARSNIIEAIALCLEVDPAVILLRDDVRSSS